MVQHKVNQMVYYSSGLLNQLGIKHGFFTRLGGVSKGSFSSLNLKQDGDTKANVAENRKRICRALGLNVNTLVFANELGHSKRARIVGGKDAGTEPPGLDALLTQTVGIPIALSVADCVPILLASQNKNQVAVVHVSWRSLNAGIVEKTLELVKGQVGQLIAALGPCIAAESYEVRDDFVQALKPHLKKFLKKIDKRLYFDLPAAAASELEKFGVSNIEVADIDTYTNTDEFYSYRKEGTTGRFGVVVSL